MSISFIINPLHACAADFDITCDAHKFTWRAEHIFWNDEPHTWQAQCMWPASQRAPSKKKSPADTDPDHQDVKAVWASEHLVSTFFHHVHNFYHREGVAEWEICSHHRLYENAALSCLPLHLLPSPDPSRGSTRMKLLGSINHIIHNLTHFNTLL